MLLSLNRFYGCECMGILYFVGLGLSDLKDISIRGKEIVEGADSVFAEFYTSRLSDENINEFFGREIRILNREILEEEKVILESAEKGNTVLLTAGDPMSATTHNSLRLSAMKRGIEVKIIHSASIFTAAPGLLGLWPYKFGRATTLARPEKGFFPTSPYDVLVSNQRIGLHTLVLLDIKAEEGYFMTAGEGLSLLLRMEEKKAMGVLSPETEVGVVARAGSEHPALFFGPISSALERDFGPPLHTIVVPGELNFMEKEMLEAVRGAFNLTPPL